MNSSRYGHQDRRKNLPGATIHVQDSFSAVYAETAFKYHTDWSDINRSEIETKAYRTAHSYLPPKDRFYIDKNIERLKEACSGSYFGDVAAMQVLARLGVFLNRVEEEGMK